jgi:hypothetical protein
MTAEQLANRNARIAEGQRRGRTGGLKLSSFGWRQTAATAPAASK